MKEVITIKFNNSIYSIELNDLRKYDSIKVIDSLNDCFINLSIETRPVSSMIIFIKDRINKLQRQRAHNYEGLAHFDEEVGTYHVRVEEQNKMIEIELCFLNSLIKILEK